VWLVKLQILFGQDKSPAFYPIVMSCNGFMNITGFKIAGVFSGGIRTLSEFDQLVSSHMLTTAS
jgi:hypothetical protein